MYIFWEAWKTKRERNEKCSAGKKERVVDEDIRMAIVAMSRKLDYLSA